MDDAIERSRPLGWTDGFSEGAFTLSREQYVNSMLDYCLCAGLIGFDNMELVERLAHEIWARRDAYVDGQRAVREASYAIASGLDRRWDATEHTYCEPARQHPAQLWDHVAPRPSDFPGRAAA